MYRKIIKPILFLLSPEKAHHFSVNAWKLLTYLPFFAKFYRQFSYANHPSLRVKKAGLVFPNRVGLAAGFDKDAKFYNEFSCMGFGFIEVGTITPKAQPGNPLPRLFRLPADEALINRMGFNNGGVDAQVKRLQSKRTSIIIGGNVGKNKSTPNENALEDYLICVQKLDPVVDYFAVNVSSPNTPDLRKLQEKEPLLALLSEVKKLAAVLPGKRPVLLKIAPDLSPEALADVIEIIQTTHLDGVIATNTTISREQLETSPEMIQEIGAGGLSGKPLFNVSTAFVKELREKLGDEFLIIASGGIISADDAIEKIKAGADLVQIYTGLIYSGPGLIRSIHKKLLQSQKNVHSN